MTSFTTRTPTLDAVAPLTPGRLHLRVTQDHAQGSSALAWTTAVDLSTQAPVLLVSTTSPDKLFRQEQLARLGLATPHPELEVLDTFDASLVLATLADLETRTGQSPVLVLEDFEYCEYPQLVFAATGNQPMAPFSRMAQRFVTELRPHLSRGTTAVVHLRRRAYSTGTSDGTVPSALRFAASSIVALRREPDRSALVQLRVDKSRDAEPFGKATVALSGGGVVEAVPSLSMDLECLRSFEAGRAYLSTALAGLDGETLSVLESSWVGGTEDLLVVLEELGPDALAP